MGAVHLARDLQLDRLVAIKELPDEYANDPSLRERFLREVKMAASFSHPNIVPVYAVEEQGRSLAFVMGFVEGESLAERVRRAGPLSAREAVRLLLDVAYALAYAHGRGVVHRDIKPDNIMIERATGRALLMDFGVARSIGTAPASQPGMTRVGEVVGTPEYMSPEQATGEDVDGRSDLYSLGLVAYYGVTGEVPFSGDSAARVLMRQLTESLPPLASLRPDLPAALATAIDRCLEKSRNDRFLDASALIEALDAAQAATPEVPLAIRLFAHEAETLGTIVALVTFVAILMLSTRATDVGIFDRLIPVVVMFSVLTGRILQTRAEVGRLLSQGFSVEVVMRGLQQTVDEREARRAQLRLDADVVRRRKSTVRVGVFMLVVAVLLVRTAFKMRTGVPGDYQTPIPAAFMLFSGLICFGFGAVLLMRSPLRPPLFERVFRVLWLGAPGRWFFRSAQPTGALPTKTAPRKAVVAATTAALSAPSDARLEALEARLARLEKNLNAK
jgi:serine/threonine-protein kinase